MLLYWIVSKEELCLCFVVMRLLFRRPSFFLFAGLRPFIIIQRGKTPNEREEQCLGTLVLSCTQ